MSGLLPFYLMRQWTNDGKLASGGSLSFFQSGTSTPKAVYQDAALTIPHTNPVTLDASGSAVIFLGAGAYSILLKDAAGAQVAPPVDGVVGGSGDGSSNASMAVLATYADVRAMATAPDFVVVCGRLAIGDGGQGAFQRIPGSTMIDDDGVVLTSASGSNVYRRETGGVIDPQWYGVQYGVSADQYTNLYHALVGSVTHNLPVQLGGSVYLNQNLGVPTKAILTAVDDGFFTATLGVTVTFPAGSRFSATGRTFGTNVNASFAANVCNTSPLSWFGDTVDDVRVAKWIASTTTSGIRLVLDESPTIGGTSLAIAQEFYAEPGCMFNVPSAASFAISIPLIRNGYQRTPIFWINPNIANVTVSFGANFAYPEWIGAAANGTTDDSVALVRAFRSGRCILSAGYSYFLGTSMGSWPASLDLTGEGILRIGGSLTIASQILGLMDVSITLDTPHTWFAGTLLVAQHASFPKTFTATSKLIDGCSYTDDTRNPSYAGTPGPALYDPHLPNTPNAAVLGTNAQGKIMGTNDLVLNSIEPTTTILHRSAPAIALFYNGETIPDTAPWLVFVNNSAGAVSVTLHGYVAGKATHHRIMGLGRNNITVNAALWNNATSFLINAPLDANSVYWAEVFIDAGGKWFVINSGA